MATPSMSFTMSGDAAIRRRTVLGAGAALLAGTALAAAPAAAARPTAGRRPSAPPRAITVGYIYDGRSFTIFEPLDAIDQFAPFGLTDSGVVSGEYFPDGGLDEIGFVRRRDGTIRTINLPGAAGTQVDTINNRGQFVGNYHPTETGLPAVGSRGYLLDPPAGLIPIDYPDAILTAPHGINDRGQVVGSYVDSGGVSHGFLWQKGEFTVIDVPGAAATDLTEINNRGTIVGLTAESDNAFTGVGVVLAGGQITRITLPGGTLAILSGVNDRGQISGTSYAPTEADQLAGARAFVLHRGVGGGPTEITYPRAPRTAAGSIDNAARVVGFYENPDPMPTANHHMVGTALARAAG